MEPDPNAPDKLPVIRRALYGPVPTEATGWLVTACMCLFIAAFSVGPGVVVWLALSELMPTRIRSTGMGIALLLNQGVSTAIAAVFLPTVGNYGYAAMFLFWAACTVIYFITAAFFLPETRARRSRKSRSTLKKARSHRPPPATGEHLMNEASLTQDLFVGIDGGATKTIVRAENACGEGLGQGQAGRRTSGSPSKAVGSLSMTP